MRILPTFWYLTVMKISTHFQHVLQNLSFAQESVSQFIFSFLSIKNEN